MGAANSGLWVTDPQAYRKKLMDQLGGRNPLDIMSDTPNVLAGIVREHPAEKLRARPFPGKWTPNEILGHLADAELVYGYRMRLILCEDNPTILGMDQELWVSGQRHNEREPADLLEMFTGLRLFNLGVWRRMSKHDLERAGQHNERGRETLGDMLPMLAGHDLSHIDQIRRYLAAVG